MQDEDDEEEVLIAARRIADHTHGEVQTACLPTRPASRAPLVFLYRRIPLRHHRLNGLCCRAAQRRIAVVHEKSNRDWFAACNIPREMRRNDDDSHSACVHHILHQVLLIAFIEEPFLDADIRHRREVAHQFAASLPLIPIADQDRHIFNRVLIEQCTK